MSKIYDSSLYQVLKNRESDFIPNINKLVKYCEDFLPKVNVVFQNYTRHDIIHSYNVLQYMHNLVSDTSLLSDYDIALCIYSALLHDIGMIADEEEITNIKNGSIKIKGKNYDKVKSRVGNENTAIQECIRPVHAYRSKEFIENTMDSKYFDIPLTDISFKKEIANICLSHNKPFEWLTDPKNLPNFHSKGRYEGSPSFIAVLLRLGDYLDIDAERAPNDLYDYLYMNEFGDSEWKMNISVENTCDNKIKNIGDSKEVHLYGESANPKVHRKLINYVNSMNKEIEKAVDYTKKLNDKYQLRIFPKIKDYIKTEGFSSSNFKLTLDYNSVTNLLMGENIYGDKKYGLREIIQNSIDACNLMLEISKNMDEYKYESYQPKISINFNISDNRVIINDNGTGMNIDIVKNNFLNVGVSYYNSIDFLDNDYDYLPIGKYGIGFLSCFMLSKNVNVLTFAR